MIEDEIIEISTTAPKQEIKSTEEDSNSIESPMLEEIIPREQVRIGEISRTINDTNTSIKDIDEKIISPTTEEKQESTDERPVVEEFTNTENAFQEKTKKSIEFIEARTVGVEGKSAGRNELYHTDEADVENKLEAKSMEDITETIEEENNIEEQKPDLAEEWEDMSATERVARETPTEMYEEDIKEQPVSVEKLTVEEALTKEEVTTSETTLKVDEIDAITEKIIKGALSIIEKINEPTEQRATVDETVNMKTVIEEKSNFLIVTIDETSNVDRNIDEKTVAIDKQPIYLNEMTLISREDIGNQIEMKLIEDSTTTIEDEIYIENQIIETTEPTGDAKKTEEIIPDIPSGMQQGNSQSIEDRIASVDGPTLEYTGVNKEVAATEFVPVFAETKSKIEKSHWRR